MTDSLELFGTFGLSYVITLQRQLPAHDLDEVLRKQSCTREQMLKTPARPFGNGQKQPLSKAGELSQCYLQAARCSNSEQSWYYSHHCWYSSPPRDTEAGDKTVWFDLKLHCCVVAGIFFRFSTPLTWIFIATSLPPFNLPKCTWPIDAAAKGFSSKYSSLSLQSGPRSLLTAFCRQNGNILIRGPGSQMSAVAAGHTLPSSVWMAWSLRSDGRARRF